MSLGQFLAIVRARWLVLAALVVAAVTTTAIISMLFPKQYTATAAVVVDIKSPDPIAGMVLPGVMSPTYLATQVDLLESERVARKVVGMLRLTESPEMRKEWQDKAKGQGDFESWLADLMSKNLKAVPSRESNVIKVEYTAADPKFASALANAFVEAYIAVTAELRVEPAKQYGMTFEALAAQLRKRLEEAQVRLSDYQKATGLMATDERLDVETARLNDLSSQVMQLQTLSNEWDVRHTTAKTKGSESTMEAMSNQLLAQLKGDLTREEAKLDALASRLGSAHPTVLESQAAIAALRGRLNAEYGRVTSTLGNGSSVNRARLAEAQTELEDQRAKLLKLKEKRNEASVMMRDVENLQRAYDVVQARVTQSSMESQATQTNLSVIQQATPPIEASSPRIFLNTALALFLGSVFGVVTVLAIELLDRRVRSNEDIMRDLQLPLVGVLLKTENAKRSFLGRRTPPWVIGRTAPLPLQNH